MNEMHSRRQRKQQERKNTIIVLAILGSFVVIAFVFWQTVVTGNERTRLVSSQLVRTNVISEAGSAHHFEARVTLEIGQTVRISNAALNQQVSDALSELRYEDIISEDGMDIIRAHVQRRLEGSGLMSPGDIHHVYVTNVLTDFVSPQRPQGQGRLDQFFRATFGR